MNENCNENIQGCHFDVEVSYKVVDNRDGKVVDEKCHKTQVGMSYHEAMAINYVATHKAAENGVKTFLEILGIDPDSPEPPSAAVFGSNTALSVLKKQLSK